MTVLMSGCAVPCSMQALRRSLVSWLSDPCYIHMSYLSQAQALCTRTYDQECSVGATSSVHSHTHPAQGNTHHSIQDSNVQTAARAAAQHQRQHIWGELRTSPANVQQQQHLQQIPTRSLQGRRAGSLYLLSLGQFVQPFVQPSSLQQQQLQQLCLHTTAAAGAAQASAASSGRSRRQDQEEEFEGMQVYLDGDLDTQEHTSCHATAAAGAEGEHVQEDLQEAEELDSEWVDGSVIMTHHNADDDSELEYDVEFDEAWEDEEDIDDLRDVGVGSGDDV